MTSTTSAAVREIPGVVREDVYPPVRPSFLTGVPAFLGRIGAAAGPPRRYTRWPEFATDLAAAGAREDGGSSDPAGGDLAAAVLGFFGNGGEVCYVAGLDPEADPDTALRDGLAALDDLPEIDLVALPDLIGTPFWSADADLGPVIARQRQLLDHCAGRGDRFAVLDAVPAVDHSIVLEQARRLDGPAAAWGALYHPWLGIAGPAGATRFVPGSGFIAGLYAAGDRAVGVHQPPAGRPFEGVVDVQVGLTDAELAELGAGRVNCSRAFPGRGIRPWGARTLSSDPAWRNVGARRVMLTIGRWVEAFLTPLAHEPNDIRLWVRIMRELSAYLEGLYRTGALKGASADEAFFVKCDNETNPPEVIDAGIVITQIGVALSVPAEFIVVRVVQDATNVTVTT